MDLRRSVAELGKNLPQQGNNDGRYHLYSAYNCIFASEFELPELISVSPSAIPDVYIHRGPVPTGLNDLVVRKVFYQLRDNTWLLTAENLIGGRILVREGQEMLVEFLNTMDPFTLRLFLLGSCMGALLLQRGLIPLHGNTIATNRGAVMIAGASGAGKSTLTLALLQQGYCLLTDDLSPLAVKDGTALVQPGFPRLKLWADTCRQFDIDLSTLAKIRPELDKFHYPVDAFCSEPLPLHALYLLVPESIDEPILQPLTGIAKMKELQTQFYKMIFAEVQPNWPWLFSHLSTIAHHTHICLVRRPKTGCAPEQLADLVTTDLAA